MKVTYVYPPDQTAHAEAFFASWQRKRSRIPWLQKHLPRMAGYALSVAVITTFVGMSEHLHRAQTLDWYDLAELVGAIATVLVVIVYFSVLKRITRYMMSAEPPLGPESTVTIDESGIVTTYAGRHTGTVWRRVNSIEEDDRFLYVICDEWEAYFVPRGAFQAKTEYLTFRDEICSQYKRSRS